MNIAIITSYPLDVCFGSGVVRTLQAFAAAFRSQGHSCKIIHPRSASPDFATFFRQRLLFNEKLSAQQLQRYDLLIGSDYDGYALDLSGIRDYVVFNGGLLADIVRFEEGETKVLLQEMADKEKQNLQKAMRVYVPSEYSAEMVTRYYGIPRDLIRIVPLGVDFKGWARQAKMTLPEKPGKQHILCVAKQYPRKGIPDLLRAFALLAEKRGALQLDLVGGGPQLKINMDLARELHVSNKVHFYGDISDQALLAAHYKKSALFCLPSYHETFGLVFAEAMCFGLPLISYEAAAIPEIVRHKKEGFLVQPGHIRELAERMEELLSDRNLANWMGRNGYLKAQKMDWSGIVPIFLEDNTRGME